MQTRDSSTSRRQTTHIGKEEGDDHIDHQSHLKIKMMMKMMMMMMLIMMMMISRVI